MRIRRIFSLLKMQVQASMRDRRTFWTMVLVPLLMMPVLVLVMPLLMAKIGTAVKLDRLSVAVEGQIPAALSAELSGGILPPLKLTPVENAEKAGDKFVVALRVPAVIPQAIGAHAATLQIYVDRADKRSAATVLIIEAAVARYNQALLAAKLSSLGISPSAMSPLKTSTISAKPGELGFNLLGMILPILLSIWTLVGGQATAIDTTVGERERATLEALLAAPISRAEVVLGKYLSVLVFGLSSGLLGLCGLGISTLIMKFGVSHSFGPIAAIALSAASAKLGLSVSLSLASGVQIALATLSLASVLSALVLLPCIYARSYKEAQMYVAPTAILAMLASAPVQMKDFFGEFAALFWLPLTGSIACISDALVGNARVGDLLAAISGNLALTTILLALALWTFKREAVIFRGV